MKRIFLGIVGVLCIILLFSCGNSNEKIVATNDNVVSTDGSTSMEKVMAYLMEHYMETNKGAKVTYNTTGSSSGIKAVEEGRCDIGLSSRELKDSEKENLIGTVIAKDGIAIIVSKENKINNLSLDDISKIFKGEIKNWSEVGGDDNLIVVIGREAASGTRDGFESITNTKDECVYSQELTSTGDVIQTVANNKNAIGYASIASIKDTVKVLSVENVIPTSDTIKNGSYKIQRPFLFVTNKNSELTESAKSFFDFAISDVGKSLIEKAGATPIE